MLFEIDYLMLVIAVHITGCDHKIRSRFIDGHWNIVDLGNSHQSLYIRIMRLRCQWIRKEDHEVNDTLHNLGANLLVST